MAETQLMPAAAEQDVQQRAATAPVLHGFFRSSASWRVRIALNLKGVAYSQLSYRLREGEQMTPDYLALNPQQLVPALQLADGTVLTQSLAIIDWLEAVYPQPRLLPLDAKTRAKVLAFALAIAADTHPVQNLKILLTVQRLAGKDAAKQWAADTNREGLAACAALLRDVDGPFCFGAAPALADLCLVPQLGNARRFGVDVTAFPRLLMAEAACAALPAFQAAAPARQPDAA